jgi:hypothetical protein
MKLFSNPGALLDLDRKLERNPLLARSHKPMPMPVPMPVPMVVAR